MNTQQTIIGIIAEYNPFHNGHAWQLAQARDQFPHATIIAVMSGNFVQRGQPAILDKWLRAKIAVENGIDLVLELPFSFAIRSAEHFARGSIGILNSLGIVDKLVFGAECQQLGELLKLAQISLEPSTITRLKENMKLGMSYPQALQASISDDIINIHTINNPNNILAVEYLKQLIQQNSSIQPHLITRHIAGYKEELISSPIASATAIRKQLAQGHMPESVSAAVPLATSVALKQSMDTNRLIMENNQALSLLALYKIRNSTPAYLCTFSDVSEGLEHKIIKNAYQSSSLSQLANSLVNKRYPQSRINRILLQALVGLHKADFPTYIRPLAFNHNGRELLGKIKTKSSLPLIAKLGKDFANIPLELRGCQVLADEIAAGDLYQLLLPSPEVHHADYLNSPSYINI